MTDKKTAELPEPEPEKFSDDFSRSDGPLTATNSWITTSGGGWTVPSTTTWPSTSTGVFMVDPSTKPVDPPEEKKPAPKLVEFPRRVTKKVVIGFVEDENDEVVWGAKLYISDFHIDYNADGTGQLTLVTELFDADPNPDEK